MYRLEDDTSTFNAMVVTKKGLKVTLFPFIIPEVLVYDKRTIN